MFDFLDLYFLLHEISVKRNVLPVGGGYKESGFEKLELCKVLVKKKRVGETWHIWWEEEFLLVSYPAKELWCF